jgi:hypothetical protein
MARSPLDKVSIAAAAMSSRPKEFPRSADGGNDAATTITLYSILQTMVCSKA